MKRLIEALVVSSCCFGMLVYAQSVDTSTADVQVEALMAMEDTVVQEPVVMAKEPVEVKKEPVKIVYPKKVSRVVSEPVILDKYKNLYETNNDTIGYIYLTDEYSYPVLQRVSDQNYYVHRDFFGEEDKNGSIFANRFSELGKSGISLLYGHTMKSGKMFHSLKYYLDEDYFREHSIIQLDTLYDDMFYKVIAVAKTSMHEDFAYYDYVGDVSEDEFYEWRDGFEKYVTRGTLSDLTYGDVITELSCCAYHVKDGRLVVILKAMKQDLIV